MKAWLRALWPWRRRGVPAEAQNAVEAARRSRDRAVEDRRKACAQRAEAESWAAQVRSHNEANRYDEFLQRAMRGHQ